MTKKLNFKHISVYKGPEESPGFLLWRVSTLWRGVIESKLKLLDLTHPQFVILAVTAWLTDTGEKVSQINIARTAGLDPNTTSQIIRGLEKKNFIERKQLTDERSKNPMLTAQGSHILSQALPLVEATDTHFFSVLSKEEAQQSLHIFQKLCAYKAPQHL